MIIGHERQKGVLARIFASYQNGGFLLYGPEGVGKFSLIKEIASASISRENLVVIENSQKSLTKDTADFIRSLLQLSSAGRRVIIINDADTLTKEAQSALLKNVEEIASDTLIFFITNRPQRILNTIRSRLQPIRFGLVETEAVESWLQAADVKEGELEKLIQIFPGQPGLIQRLNSEKEKLNLVVQFLKEKLPVKKMLLSEKMSKELELAECLRYLLIFERINLFKNFSDQTIVSKIQSLLNLYFDDSDFYLNKSLQIKNLCLNYD